MFFCRRKILLMSLSVLIFNNLSFFANDFYNSLVDDLLNAGSYGYKGMNLETHEIDFSNKKGEEGYILSPNDTSFYIESEKGFFKVISSTGEYFYTRNGEFLKRGDDYYLAYANYKLATTISDCDNPGIKKTQIFYPTDRSTIKRYGYLFSFSEVVFKEEEIISGRLELPNIDSLKILFTMKKILNKSPEKYNVQLDIIDKMILILMYDKMHQIVNDRKILELGNVKKQMQDNPLSIYQIRFKYSTSWAQSFSEYIKMLYI